jgi:hypothetical protein
MQASKYTEKKTRLGDILIDKGLINEAQLIEAIACQKESDSPLGQILVDKGWVTQRQIDRALKVQSKLRNALVSSIISLSPLALVGCGSAAQGEDEPVAIEQVEEIGGQSAAADGNDDNGQESDSSGISTNVDSGAGVLFVSQNAEPNGADSAQETSEQESTLISLEDFINNNGDTSETENVGADTPASEDVAQDDSLDAGSSTDPESTSTNDSAEETETEEQVSAEESTEENEPPVVEEPALTSVEFNWSYPSQRADGSDFEVYEVQSFRIYQVSDSGEQDKVHEVSGSDTSFTVTDLPNGEYGFAITVIDTDGLESELSEEVTLTI